MVINITWSWKPANIIQRVKNWQNIPRSEFESLFGRIENDAVKTMKRYAPSDTGKLKNSITVTKKLTKYGYHDLRRNSSVGATVPYAGFIDKGTKRSTGRYVPAIEKRLVNPRAGWHPGVKATNFTEKTAKDMDGKIKKHIKDFENRWRRRLRF